MRSAATWCAMVAAFLALGTLPAGGAESLADVLREAGWDRILGTWVGDNGRGGEMRVTYAWRFKDRLAEITTRDAEDETVSLVGHNPTTGKVFNLWSDNRGGCGRGEWRLEGDQTVLEMAFVSGNGQEGTVRARQRLEGNDTLVVTVSSREPVTYTLKRAKAEIPKEPNPPNPGAAK